MAALRGGGGAAAGLGALSPPGGRGVRRCLLCARAGCRFYKQRTKITAPRRGCGRRSTAQRARGALRARRT